MMKSEGIHRSKPGTLYALLLFLAGMALSVAGAYFQYQQIDRDGRREFERLSERTEQVIADRLENVVHALRGVRGMYSAVKQSVSREEFRRFVLSREINTEFPGVRGFGFVQRLASSDVPAFVKAAQHDGAPEFAIQQLTDKGNQDLFVVKFIEPAVQNPGVQGLDLGSESIRRSGIQQAINTGAATSTGAITLVQDAKKLPGFLLYLPIYRAGAPIDVPQERRAALVGVLYAPIVMSEILQGMPDVQSGMLDFEVVDSPINRSGGVVMFDADSHIAGLTPGADPGAGPRYSLRKPLQLPGRSVTLSMQSTRAFDASLNVTYPWLLFGGGTLISALLAIMLRQQAGGRMRAETLARDMTKDLQIALGDNQTLYRVTSAIIEQTDLEELLQNVADSVAEALPADRVAIITFDLAEQRVLHFVKAGRGIDSVKLVAFDELMHGLSGWVIRESVPALSLRGAPDPRESPEVQKRRADTHCGDIIVVPLRHQGKTLGTMTAINSPQGASFGQSQVDLMMAIATHSAVAITTGQNQAQLQAEIEERKSLEISLALARDQALESSRLKSSFLANMSHEIRTPMNAILGMLNLLQSTELTVRQHDYAGKTENAAKSLLGLLNDILDFSKVEAGKMTLECEPFRIDKLLRNLGVVLSANVGTKNVELLFDLDASLPAVVMGDAMRLQQVLINLGGNAVKFTSEGQVVLALRKLDQTNDSVAIEFSVKDTGIGIAPEHQSHIFSGFSQAEGSTTRRFGGTGLGLAISKRFVELMGGDIHITSSLGEGSTFSFVLEMPTVAVVPQELSEPDRPELSPQRVLVVEDNPMAGELTLRMVRTLGWTAELATTGTQALEMISDQSTADSPSFPYTLIYMDWQLPDMDGWEATRHIRRIAQRSSQPQPVVIMVTAHGREMLAQRTEVEQNMLNGFLVKPVTPSLLYEALLDARAGKSGLRIAAKGRSNTRLLSGMRILVVEDNLINQQVADELLSAAGAIVSLAANGQMGVEAVAAAAPQFDVVLMDVQMPVLDGYGATRAIREELRLTQLPIVAMTANAMASDREACIAAGMNEHIGKPFDMAKLASLLIRMTGFRTSDEGLEEFPALNVSDSALPEVAGLDLHTALGRMSGMRALYVRTAQDFVKIMDSIVPELQEFLVSGDKQLALMRLHTLKGNAGTLGAMELASMAAKLETLCKTSADTKDCTQGLEAFEVLIRSTQGRLKEAIERLKTPTATPAVGASAKTGALESLQKISLLLAASDLEALQFFAEAREALSAMSVDFTDQLDEALQNLDLQTAHALCVDMLSGREAKCI